LSSQASEELKHGCLSMLAQRSEETGTDSATIGDMAVLFLSIQHGTKEKQKSVDSFFFFQGEKKK
jgi:hypothetical protein